MKKIKINKKAMNKLNASRLPKSLKEAFTALFGLAEKTNASNASFKSTWHEDDVADDVFVPYITVGVAKVSELKKKKRNTKKYHSFTVNS